MRLSLCVRLRLSDLQTSVCVCAWCVMRICVCVGMCNYASVVVCISVCVTSCVYVCECVFVYVRVLVHVLVIICFARACRLKRLFNDCFVSRVAHPQSRSAAVAERRSR